jgi:hypothetical protein
MLLVLAPARTPDSKGLHSGAMGCEDHAHKHEKSHGMLCQARPPLQQVLQLKSVFGKYLIGFLLCFCLNKGATGCTLHAYQANTWVASCAQSSCELAADLHPPVGWEGACCQCLSTEDKALSQGMRNSC